jgi:hypothetical protein
MGAFRRGGMCERETDRVKNGVGSINRENKERSIGLW